MTLYKTIINFMEKIELMAPVGDFESLRAAIDSGADSIYFGVDHLNMRARSSANFSINDLPVVGKICKKKGIRCYLTLNTIIYDHDLSIIKKLSDKAYESGINAIIALDQAVILYAYKIGMEVHISTQLNVTNIETVKFYSSFADTIVLSRELSLNQIKKIVYKIEKYKIKGPSGKLIRIEIFCHGALCMAVSGKCYLSLHSRNSSANRGACSHNCRKKYTLLEKESGFKIDINNEYFLSTKDLCTIHFLDKIIESGIKVLKIEGRGKSPEYVAVVTTCYRKAIDFLYQGNFDIKKVMYFTKRLKSVYNRGFWGGYYLGQKLGEWSKISGSLATRKKIFLGKGRHYYSKARIGEFSIEASKVKVGDRILVTGPITGVKEVEVLSIMVNDSLSDIVVKGQVCTIPLNFKIRSSDKLYKLVNTECIS